MTGRAVAMFADPFILVLTRADLFDPAAGPIFGVGQLGSCLLSPVPAAADGRRKVDRWLE